MKHVAGGKQTIDGGSRAVPLGDVPPEVLDASLRAARCIGDGFYGVDLKQADDGIFVIELNDDPNLNYGIEDAAEKDEVWIRLTKWFIDRLER